ncbi:probable disease resistance protein At5g63020 [Malania oleifera]|uniref:probable disease resistance protein At5g63020 n=1 Tax=Malania oleifera TaxID=397392 RepID=UPI0025ADAE50|nr:probable disease resistance protein At5g63020 [Malania oleifera]XP_057969077.1 probable disease resistance protein At5g63020 [Malania oleifera]XP_057969078.1 probable disease resistance protein At5g63020 [Malania oleifera]
MDLIGPILDIASRLWDGMSKCRANIFHLEENLNSLRNEMSELKRAYEDVKIQVEVAEEQQMRRTRAIDGWLSEVEALEKEVNGILDEGNEEIRKKCLGGCCPINCRSSYKLGKRVSAKLNSVVELKKKGPVIDVVANRLPRSPVDDQPMEQAVGLDSVFDRVCELLNEEKVRIIGIYGMGGVGKTTLTKKVNNEFLKARCEEFGTAVWAVVSKPLDVEKIQQAILNKFQVPEEEWRTKSINEKATKICKILQTKKYVLLLDDIWEPLDLLNIGVPPDDKNKSKVIFTTRSEELCSQMGADRKIEVQCLKGGKAMDLFKSKVGEETLSAHPDIERLAERVADECKGLPLALITIGRAMLGKKKPEDWEKAIKTLRKFPSKFSGMGSHVYPVLKFSYDSLEDETIKLCFIYCSIFPEDYRMDRDDLIKLWIGEGYFDEIEEGEEIIKSLKSACLLMGSVEVRDLTETVCMHDVLRDMALWLGCECGLKKNKILVQEEDVTKWEEAEKVHLQLKGTNLLEKVDVSLCPNLRTLILGDAKLNAFPKIGPALTVLDISDNENIDEIPCGIGALVSLQYLNLSRTRIVRLPLELQNLTKLRCFIINKMYRMKGIIRGVTASFSSLRVFEMQDHEVAYDSEYILLEELECLKHVAITQITIKAHSSAQKFLSSPKLQSCTRHLQLLNCAGMTSLKLQSSMRIYKLEIEDCKELKEVAVVVPNSGEDKEKDNPSIHYIVRMWDGNNCVANLRVVTICFCPLLVDLKWLIFIPNLQVLGVAWCESIEEIIPGGGDGSAAADSDRNRVFSRLTILELWDVPRLTSIYGKSLSFPSLTHIDVVGCPNLKNIPTPQRTVAVL